MAVTPTYKLPSLGASVEFTRKSFLAAQKLGLVQGQTLEGAIEETKRMHYEMTALSKKDPIQFNLMMTNQIKQREAATLALSERLDKEIDATEKRKKVDDSIKELREIQEKAEGKK